MSTAMYVVEGLACDSCMSVVLESVHSLPGVSVVTMDLVTGGGSPLLVSSGTKLGTEAVRDAVEKAGFELTSARGPEARGRGDVPPAREGGSYPDRLRVVSLVEGVS
ncbi:MAG: heavy-metal-associated domain-containing protein [Actinomycetota bacterium]